MKCLFSYANDYIKKCDWKDIALIKLCLCSIGILIGVNISSDKKKTALIAAISTFILSYIPLMYKFLKPILCDNKK